MTTKKAAPAKDVNAYLAALPADAKAALQKLREAIQSAAPQAEESVSFRLPYYRYLGPLVAFRAASAHCGFHVMSHDVLNTFKAELKGYDVVEGTIRFQPGNPLPAALVKKLVKARVAENDVQAAAKASGKGMKKR